MQPTAKANPRSHHHLIAPDLLRGAAIVMVLFFHVFGPMCGHWLDLKHDPLAQYTFFPISFFWTGVALFFVLSGFCIHFSFLKSVELTWSKFFWLRIWRLYPAYIIALVFFTVFTKINLRTFGGIALFGSHALFLHNISGRFFGGINPAFWSLAVEVQLYLLFPLVILARKRWGIEGSLVVTGTVALLARGLVCVLWGLPDRLGEPAFSSPFTSWFDWTLGAFVAERFTQNRRGFKQHSLWLLILFPLFFISTISTVPASLFSFSLAAVISAVILDLLVATNLPKSRFLSVATFIGTISYSVYLWHQPLLHPLSDHLQFLPIILRWIVVLALIFGISTFSWFFIERTGIKLGHLIWKSWQERSVSKIGQAHLANQVSEA